jgi:ArsR family transcriptional regulator, arsenate/arsenite/antimonite-responsive transcriptional repressor
MKKAGLVRSASKAKLVAMLVRGGSGGIYKGVQRQSGTLVHFLTTSLVCWYIYQHCNITEVHTMISFEEAEIRSKIIKAMAHPARLMMIDEMKAGERSFSHLFDLFELDKSTVSKHLLVLKEAGIVSSRKSGADMIYKLEVPCVTDFFSCVTAVIENNVRRQQVCICKAG